MIERRPFKDLTGDNRAWLKAKHHFSFVDIHAGWGALRIWNDDEIAPNGGFPPHPHMSYAPPCGPALLVTQCHLPTFRGSSGAQRNGPQTPLTTICYFG